MSKKKKIPEKQIKKSRPITKIVIMLLVLVVVFISLMIMWPKKPRPSIISSKKIFTTKPTALAQEEDFLTNRLIPLLMELTKLETDIPAINRRMNVLQKQKQKHHGDSAIRFKVVSDETLNQDIHVFAVSGLAADGKPEIIIFHNRFQSVWENLLTRTDRRSAEVVFRCHVFICIAHEHEHLARGHLHNYQPTPEEIINGEHEVCTATCEHIMQPLVQTYGQGDSAVLGPFFQEHYDAWVLCQAGSCDPWTQLMLDIYGE